MARRRRRVLAALGVVFVLLLAAGGAYLWVAGQILAGHAAKTLCTCVFVARREANSCLSEELGPYRPVTTTRIDREARRVDATGLFVRHAHARYRDGLGCALD